MKRVLGLAVATVAVIGLSPLTAKADLFVGACASASSCVPSDPANTLAFNSTNALLSFSSGLTPIGSSWDVSGSAALTFPANLGSNTLDVTHTGGSFPSTLDIYVTGTNITLGDNFTGIRSSFQVLSLPAGWTAQEATYVNVNNGVYATQQLLSTTPVLSGPIPPLFSLVSLAAFVPPGTPFSITEVYQVTAPGFSGSGQFQGDIHVNAVPGPIVGAGLPGLLFGFGGLIAWARRGRRSEIAAD